MMQRRDADDVHKSMNHADVCDQVFSLKIGVIDFGHSGKLTDTDIRCFESPSIDRVFHSPSCEHSECDTMLNPHGFSCASIISGAHRTVNFFDMGEYVIEGAFPSAQLYTYALGCGRYLPYFGKGLPQRCICSPDLVNKAICQAEKDGVKVISMSISDRLEVFHNMNHPKEDIIGMMTLEAYGRGVLTCTALGNDGPTEESAIYGWPWALTVGACTTGEVLVTDIEIAIDENVPSIDVLERRDYGDKEIMITHLMQGASLNVFETQFLPLRVNEGEKWSEERVLFGDMSAGTCHFFHPLPAVRRDLISPNFSKWSMVLISKEDVDQLRTLHEKLIGKRIFVRILKSKYKNDERGFLVPEFSARGPSTLYKDHITPDVVAPGYAVRMSHPSDIPLNYKEFEPTPTMTTDDTRECKRSRVEKVKEILRDYTIGSGTSFACPRVAASALALWSQYPEWEPSAVISALITTAWSCAERDIPGNEFTYGAGLIDLEKALHPGLVYEEIYDRYRDYVKDRCELNDLNLPTFAAGFSDSSKNCVKKFKRKLKDVNTNVYGGEVVYTSKIVYFHRSLDPRVEMKVEPPSLKFKSGEEHDFVLSVGIKPYPGPRLYVSAMLKWVPDGSDLQSVCSPIHLYSKSMTIPKV